MRILLAVSILGFVAVVHSSIYSDVVKKEWEVYKEKYGKIYEDGDEDQFRMSLYMQRKLEIAENNKLYEQGKSSYEMETNHFADLTEQEHDEMLGNFMPDAYLDLGLPILQPQENNDDLPENLDWTKKGAVTPVQNQGECGACWAFATVGALEGHQFLKTKKLVKLSEQQLVDCDPFDHGCRGGRMYRAYYYLYTHVGSALASKYPYEDRELGECRFNKSFVGAKVRGLVNVKKYDEEELKKAVAVGPVSVGIDIRPLFHYKGGIFDSADCRSLNHAVVVVGYGVDENGTKYWKLKNSWGKHWGESGYYRMIRGKDMCRVSEYASYPEV